MLKQRIFTAIIALLVLAIVLFVLPEAVARGFLALLFLAGAWEWGGFLFAERKAGRLGYVVFIAIAMVALFSFLADDSVRENVLKVGLAWWLVALAWMLFFPTPIPAAITWICGALVLVPAWAALDYLYLQSPELLVFVLLIVWVADMGAFFVGKGFGKVKLAPSISPGKTWEGVLGGLAAVMVLASVASRVFDMAVGIIVPFCLAVAMLSVVGDLAVSMFKRTAGVKDSGTLFPGHGGVLDRIDSVTAAAPLFALAMAWVGLQ